MKIALQFEVSRPYFMNDNFFARDYLDFISVAKKYTKDNRNYYQCFTEFIDIDIALYTSLSINNSFLSKCYVSIMAIFEYEDSSKEPYLYLANVFSDFVYESGIYQTFYPHMATQRIELVTTNEILTSNFTLDSKKIIENNATLTLSGITVSPNSAPYNSVLGFELRNGGKLVIENSILNLGNALIVAIGEGCEIIVRDSINRRSAINTTGGKIELRDGAILIFEPSTDFKIENSGKLILSSSSHIETNNSNLTIANSDLTLSGSSTIDINNNSVFNLSGSSEIVGNVYNRDAINFYNSHANFGSGTTIRSGTLGQRWSGLAFYNCNQTTSEINSNISGIAFIFLNNSKVSFNNSEITNINRIGAYNGSELQMNNVYYHHNDGEILISQSGIQISNSQINNITNHGIAIHSLSTTNNFIINSNINNNLLDGVSINNGFIKIENSQIFGNAYGGFRSSSQTPSIIHKASRIYLNETYEVSASGLSFPLWGDDDSYYLQPSVGRDDIANYPPGFPVLNAYGPMPIGPIDCTRLLITTSRPDLFYPSIDSFIFSPFQDHVARSLYKNAISAMMQEDYVNSYDLMYTIVTQYRRTLEARLTNSFIPYLTYAIKGGYDEVYELIESLVSENDEYQKAQILAITFMLDGKYNEAIEQYQYILDNPDSPEDSLLAELNQSYCYLLQYQTGSRNLLDIAGFMPTSFDEYTEYAKKINRLLDRLSMRYGDDEDEVLPEVFKFSTSNYPNPFNPSTTIQFTINSEQLTSIDIFNIKGQKVRNLVSGPYPKGNHKVNWNGRDDNNRAVSSGIYFYRLQTGENTVTRKMLLMK